MNRYNIDVAVLCIFFARPNCFKQVFEAVRKARPKTLLLWQDGPRKGREDDVKNIEECRKIADNIDWDCTVYKNYHDENMGCDPSTHLSHKWAFSLVDKCIILEDDIVPSQSFFPFCKELLDKYEFDRRVSRICGMNILGEYDAPSDYFFARSGNSWGWATWKREADLWETEYGFIDDPYAKNCLMNYYGENKAQEDWMKTIENYKKEGVPYWEFIVGATTLLHNGLIIYPSKNMICNVGIDANSTHAHDDINKLPKSVQRLFYMKTYEYDFPLKEPKYFVCDNLFTELCRKVVSTKSRFSGVKKVIKKILRK